MERLFRGARTGRFDRNGASIHEGDIVITDERVEAIIRFNARESSFTITTDKWKENLNEYTSVHITVLKKWQHQLREYGDSTKGINI